LWHYSEAPQKVRNFLGLLELFVRLVHRITQADTELLKSLFFKTLKVHQ